MIPVAWSLSAADAIFTCSSVELVEAYPQKSEEDYGQESWEIQPKGRISAGPEVEHILKKQ